MASPGRPTLLHVCGRFLPLSETFTYDLIKGLDGFNHHVVASGIENLQHFPLANVSVPEPEERAWGIAKAVDARAVICHFGPQATMGMPIALAIDRPAVTIFHGYDISRLLRDKRWVERYRAVAALGMHALCISEAGRERLRSIGWPEPQLHVVRLGVDSKRFAFRPPSERWGARGPRRILMVARLVEKKGVHVALEAMQKLHDRGLDLELRVIGDGPERQRLESIVAETGLTKVRLLGALAHEQTRQEFADADLYVQPSITADTGDQEGIPVSLMEAQASGLPVVSTRHSGIPELVVHGTTGWLTDEGDAEGLAIAVERLARDPERAQSFAQAGRARVRQEFDRDTQTGRFAAYLEKLVGSAETQPSVFVARRARPGRRGLLIRSIPLGLMARKLLLLGHRHPDVEWEVLTSLGSASSVKRMPLVSQVWTYENGELSLERIGADMLAYLQTRQYDITVVPYTDESGDDMPHIRRIATELGAGQTLALTLRDQESPLSARRRRLHPSPTGTLSTLPRGA
jgi:colanic acid/amylovoran biosynthesis glycosyltransferase